jgi:hypothetical protein
VLFREDDIDRYNPEEHQSLLEAAAIEVPVLVTAEEMPELGDRLETVTDDALADRMAQTSVELLARFAGRDGTATLLTRIDGLFRSLLASGRLELATTLAEDVRRVGDETAARPGVRAAIDETLGADGHLRIGWRRCWTPSRAADPRRPRWCAASWTRSATRARRASSSPWPGRRTSRGGGASSISSCPSAP